MSQPRQPTPSQSPTPSKSSLRRTSGAQNPSQRSLIPPPSPHFDDQPPTPVRYSPRSPPNQTLEYESDEDDEPLIYPDPPPVPSQDSYFPIQEPEAQFRPFFTLIEDGLTSEHHHPSVHYIFADDDSEIITEAALRSLSRDDISESSVGDGATQPSDQNNRNNDGHHVSHLSPPVEGTREHYLILDVQPISQAQAQAQQQQQQSQTQAHSHLQSNSAPPIDFLPPYTVTSYTSLSPDWQISSAAITSAPTMGDTPSEDEGFMLRIEGRGIPAEDLDLPLFGGGADRTNKAGITGDDKDGRGRDTLESLIERFQSRLGEVRKLIEVDAGMLPPEAGAGAGAGTGAGGDGPADAGYGEGERAQYGLEEQD